MKVNFELNDIETDRVIFYIRRAYVKRFSIYNRVEFLSGKTKDDLLLYIPLVLSCYYIVLSLVFSIWLGFTLSNILIYVLSLAFGFSALRFYKNILSARKMQFLLLSLRKFMRKSLLMVSLAIHTRRLLQVIESSECNLNIHGDTGEVYIKSGVIQCFNLHTLIEEAVFKEVIFYSFIDSAIGKRCLIPVPLRCLNDFKSAISSTR